jgi:hypothetical protein
MNPIGWLRLEAAAELSVACWLYSRIGGGWYLFAILFLVPDIGMLGYLAGPRAGAWSYNILHTFAIAAPLAMLAFATGHPMLLAIALIWCAHISFDRMVGYGLKSPVSFQTTHLGILGRRGAR